MKCPKCGCVVTEQMKFCSSCGCQIVVEIKATDVHGLPITRSYDKRKKYNGIVVFAFLFCAFFLMVVFGVDHTPSQDQDLEDFQQPATSQVETEPSTIEFEETVVIDESDIFVQVNSGDVKNGIALYIENNSTQDISLSLKALAINGIMYDEYIYMYESVPQGKKSSKNISISNVWLSSHSVTDIEYIDISFSVYGENDYSYVVKNKVAHVKTSAYQSDSSWDFDKTTELYPGLHVGTQGYGTNYISIVAINDTDYTMVVDIENVSVNDWAYDTGLQVYSEWLLPGCAAIYVINIDAKFLSDNNITEIEKFEFAFDIAPSNDIFDIRTTDIFTLVCTD